MQPDDETRITEISFLPDGRICVFGMSREVLELLDDLNLGDPRLARRRELHNHIESTIGEFVELNNDQGEPQ